MRDNGTEYTCKVTRRKGDAQLRWLWVVFLTLSENVPVEEFHEPLKSHKLDNSVWDLPGPQWDDSFVESLRTYVTNSVPYSLFNFVKA